jgi:hypothetical protein
MGALDIIMLQRASIQNHDRAMHRPTCRRRAACRTTPRRKSPYAASQVAKELQQMVAYVAEDATPSSVGAPPREVRAFACCNREAQLRAMSCFRTICDHDAAFAPNHAAMEGAKMQRFVSIACSDRNSSRTCLQQRAGSQSALSCPCRARGTRYPWRAPVAISSALGRRSMSLRLTSRSWRRETYSLGSAGTLHKTHRPRRPTSCSN